MTTANIPASHDFFAQDLSFQQARHLTADALAGADDGELYLEYTVTENLVWTDGKLRNASYDVDQGFGLRAVAGEFTAYAHSSALTIPSLQQAASTVTAARAGYNGSLSLAPAFRNGPALYADVDPLAAANLTDKIALLQKIDAYIRGADSAVTQVTVAFNVERKLISIVRADADAPLTDSRPLVNFSISVTMTQNGRMEKGGHRAGGRATIDTYINESAWHAAADDAIRQARVNLQSVPTPAGETTVVLGSGWPGMLFHEAVGHGLEGDSIRKGVSMFSGGLGSRVAAPGVTVVDDGAMPDLRGSINIDDEGTPSQRNVLIEDGILVNYMQDRMNARLMQRAPTGNGRRETYAAAPMPRMTNTFLENGTMDPAEIIASVKDGIYATDFSGGQVDTASGRFVFSMCEAYKIENGKITTPLKGATLIGSGHETLHNIKLIGNDLVHDNGMCGKRGQGVPVCVGQPTLRLDHMIVGGAG